MTSATIIIPALNEQQNLQVLLPKLQHEVAQFEPQIEVVIVIGRSEDALTYPQGLGPNFKFATRDPSDVFGDAIRTGISASSPNSDFIIFMDADGSHSPKSLIKLLQAPTEHDVVVASRYTRGGTTDNSFALRLMSQTLNFAYRVVLGIPCNDLSTNFKRFRRADLIGLKLSCKNFDIVEELIFRVKYSRGKMFSILEIPDHFAERMHGESKRRLGPYIASYLWTLLTLRWKVAASHNKNA